MSKSRTPPSSSKSPSLIPVDPRASGLRTFTAVLQTWLILSLSNVAILVLRSCLSPVYGRSAAAHYHQTTTLAAHFVCVRVVRRLEGTSRAWSQKLAVSFFFAPSIVLYLFRYSGTWGAAWGPLISTIIAIVPITLGAAVATSKMLDGPANSRFLAVCLQDGALSRWRLPNTIKAGITFLIYWANSYFSELVCGYMWRYLMWSRLGCYYVLAVIQACFSPSRHLLLAVLPVLHTVFFTPYIPSHYSDKVLNATLHGYGYSLVARQESNTGYISVLDNIKDGFRVMRCDHSLLGGEWFAQPGHEHELREPVYAIFVMLEAVRLVEPISKPQETGEGLDSALVMYTFLIPFPIKCMLKHR